MSKFFNFVQNNSGGIFEFNIENGITHHVVIEATNYRHANRIAEGIGIYFNGCATGEDCSCCGDRWYEEDTDSIAKDFPHVSGEHVNTYSTYAWMRPGYEIAVHYLDGRVEWHGVDENKILDENNWSTS